MSGRVSYSPEPQSPRLSEKLTSAKIKKLSSLILRSEHPQTSDAVVGPLLELLVEGSFDLKENFLIKEPSVVLLLLELLPSLSEPLQLEIWSTLGAILHRSLSNIHMCRQLHLIQHCLEYLRKTTSDRVAGHVTRVIEILGSYSLSLKELRDILSYLYTGQMKTWAPHSILLVGALNNMAVNVQPDVFFSFSGQPGATVTLPPMTKWPTQSGFTLTTWIRLEKPFDSQRDYYKPVVYWFRTGRPELGYSAHFVGNTLVLETMSKGSKKPQTHAVNFSFQSYQWYMLTVVYVHHRLKSSELCCYVNGKAVMNAEVNLPNTDDVYDKCFLGSSPSAREDVVFQGQMAAVYLFREPLGYETVETLYKLGPSYKSQFKFAAESDAPLSSQEKKILFDGRLSNIIVFSYNVKAVDGQLCLEASPNENQIFFAHSPHATLLEGVYPVVTTSFHSALQSLGGAQALFPLVSQLDLPQSLPQNTIDYSLSVRLLALVFEMARYSTSFMLQLVQMNATELLTYLLEKVSAEHLSVELVSCVFDFLRYVMDAPNGREMLCQLVEQLLLSAGLWARANRKVQTYLYSHLATEFSARTLGKTGLALHELAGVGQLLFILKEHYSLVGGARGDGEDRSKVRAYLLLIVKEFITKCKGIHKEDMESIVDYLCTIPHEENLHDVLVLLLGIVFEDTHIPGNVVKMFHDSNGLNMATKLLACTSEELTLHALKLIGKILHHSNDRQQESLVQSVGLFSVIREKLLSAGQPVTIAMFNTLFEVLVDCPSRKIIDSHYLALDLAHHIKFPDMLAVMVELICTLHTALSEWEESDMLVRMQLFSYVSSLCAQNKKNCRALLKLQHWQHWLLRLADQRMTVESDHNSLQEMLYKLFHTVLMYSLQEEQDGWRVWVETAAAMHAYAMSKIPFVVVPTTDTSPEVQSTSVSSLREELAAASPSSSTLEDQSNGGIITESIDGGSTISITEDIHQQDNLESTPSEDQLAVVVQDDSRASSTVSTPQSPMRGRFIPSPLDIASGTADSPSLQLSRTLSPLARGAVKAGAGGGVRGGGGGGGVSPRMAAVGSHTPPGVSRVSSLDSPQSPFFIPTNPFLMHVEKMPKFQWTMPHFDLLENILKSLQEIVNKWKIDPKRSLSDYIGEENQKFLRSNVAHLLALTVDSVVGLNGGLKQLLALSTNLKLSSKLKRSDSLKHSQAALLRAAIGEDPSKAAHLIHLCLELAEVMVLNGFLKLSVVEARMKMEPGGVERQALRLVLAETSLSTIQHNNEFRTFHQHYAKEKHLAALIHKESISLLQGLGIGEGAMEKYFDDAKEKKLTTLHSSQCLLSRMHLSRLQRFIPKDGESKQLLQHSVVTILYYLSVMSVSKYNSILQATERDERTKAGGGGGDDLAASESSMTSLGSYASATLDTAAASVSADLPTTMRPRGDTESSLETNEAESSSPQEQALSFIQGGPPEQSLAPSSFTLRTHALDISEQVEAAMEMTGPFICQLLIEHKSLLSKVLVGADGKSLLTDAVMGLARNKSVVEVTMLLCSQEWQASLQKNGGKVFSELLAEGRHVARFCESYMRGVASKAMTSIEQLLNNQITKFTDFEEQLSLFLSQSIRSANESMQLRRADVTRHSVSARNLWRKISSVVDENGSFDVTPLKHSKFWQLDLKEDSLRQRLQFLPNPAGSVHESAIRSVEEEEEGNKPTTAAEGELAAGLPGSVDAAALNKASNFEVVSLSSDDPGELPLEQLDKSEQLLLTIPCSMVVLAHSIPGTLAFTRTSLTFTADDSTEEYENASYLADYCCLNEQWPLQDVVAVFSRHYLHQNRAIEVFFSDRSSAFFAFESNREVKTAVRRLPKVGAGTAYDFAQTRATSLASPQQLFKRSSMTGRWERREITNFEYLIYLNTVAGRSYNDLNQYPVFPWILTDYTSPTLDLSDPNVYRDLTKPMGAVNPSRLSQFEERFESFEDDNLPPFYYGTHYSTMAFVLHWLVRVEPYSSMHIAFHDGVFDQGSRLFSALHNSWHNSTEDSSDVNELIPEFFYLPEMFLNENKFNLGHEGACGEGDVISDVQLPPWASSAHDFVRTHREALESEYVSANLHHWIDLIFGYKQRGDEAVKAKNVFYYLTYTGAVDLESIQDSQLRKGLEDQIRHFGQTPVQLLTEPHPSRQPLEKKFPPLPVHGLNPKDPALVAEQQVTPDVPIALVQLSSLNQSSLLSVSYSQLYAFSNWSISQGTASQPPTVAMEPDPNIWLRSRLGDPLDQSASASAACFSSLPSCEVIFVCGFWDNSFKCFASNTGDMIQSVFGHRGIVTCVGFSPEDGLHGNKGDGLIGSGSQDTTVLLWKWSGRLNRVTGPLSKIEDSLVPLAVLTGHEQPIASLSVSCTLGIVVSGSKYGYSLVHTTYGELLHKLVPSTQWLYPHLTTITRNGSIVIHYADQKGGLVVYSCNGEELCQQSLGDRALALVATGNGRYLITGGFAGVVRVFHTHDLRLKYKYEPFGSSIRSLHVPTDQKFIFAGLASGSVAALTTHFWMK